MFSSTSRYKGLATTTWTSPTGEVITYVNRRILPQGSEIPLHMEVATEENDRLDLIAARAIGSAEHFWRICDATDAMSPFDLTEHPGDKLRVPVPGSY